MCDKFTSLGVIAVFLLGSLVSSRAQDSPAGLPALPPPGVFMMQAGGAEQGFQIVSGEPPFSTQVVKGAPYALDATIETVQSLADGNRIVHRQTVHLYRDSKGRTRREETLAAIGPWAASGTPPTMVTIQDPVSGVSYFLDPQRKTATKLPAMPMGKGVMVTRNMVGGEPATETVSTPPAGATFVSSGGEGKDVVFGFHTTFEERVPRPEEKSESLEKETIAGVLADGTRTTATIAANTMGNERPLDIVRERWYSPELQIVLRSKQSDPRFGETTYEVTKLDRGEPAPSIFEIPSDYKVIKGDTRVVIRREGPPK